MYQLASSIARLVLASLLILSVSVSEPIKVTYENFATVETGKQMERYQKLGAGSGKWMHLRQPTPLDKQTTIRMNRDTLYSFTVVNVKKGAAISLPESGGRYMSLMPVNQHGFTNEVWYGGGKFALNSQVLGSDYVFFVVRTLVDANDPHDVAKVNALQDQFKVESRAGEAAFVAPSIEESSYQTIYTSLLNLFKLVTDTKNMFGNKTEVDPVRFLIGTAGGFGGLPTKDAFYMLGDPHLPVAKYSITFTDVPVQGFWSITIYDKDGYMSKAGGGVPNLNNLTAKKEANGSFVIRLGGCEDGQNNCLGLMEGWNYGVRLYQPGPSILSGDWKLPPFVKLAS